MTKILVIDDEPRMCKTVKGLLSGAGHKTSSSQTGGDALENLRNQRFDVVLLDLKLPDMDGRLVMREIRQRDPETSIIILTGDSSTASAIAAVKQGAFDYLQKPCDPDILAKTVANAVDRQREKQARRRAEKELYKKTRELEDVLESISDGFFTLDERLVVTYFNKAAGEILGRPRQEVLGQPLFEAFPEAKSSIFERNYGLALKERKPLSFETYFGTSPYQNWYQVRVYPKMRGISVFFQVTTEQKEMEQALRESEAKYRDLFHSIRDAILVADRDRNIVGCNTSFSELFEYSLEEIRGQKTHVVYADREEYKKMGEKLRQSFGIPRFVYTINYIKKSGVVFTGETSVFYLKNNDNEITGFIGMIRDVTARIKADEERYNLENQLHRAQKMESIGILAGGIAHDFNNILSPIMVQTELAKLRIAEDDPAQDNLEEVIKASYRARDLVKQILTFGRQSNQRRVSMDLGPMIKESLKLMRSSIPKTIAIRQAVSDTTGKVMADPSQMQQVLMNLCANASQAMQEMGSVLEVAVDNIELDEGDAADYPDIGPGCYVMLRVSDTGMGIDPEVMEKIFDPFFTTKPAGEGTGMGLSVVYGIVRSHGGDICVESEPGKGATFRVLLPWLDREVKAEPEENVQSLCGGNERILYVDDEESVAAPVGEMLSGFGYEVEINTSPTEALSRFQNDPHGYDLVITDMTMPNLTGEGLAREVMRIRPDMPVIICTGFSHRISETKVKAMGVKGLLMKPFVMTEAANMIRKILDEH